MADSTHDPVIPRPLLHIEVNTVFAPRSRGPHEAIQIHDMLPDRAVGRADSLKIASARVSFLPPCDRLPLVSAAQTQYQPTFGQLKEQDQTQKPLMAGPDMSPNTSGLCESRKAALSGSFLLCFILRPTRALRCCNSAPGCHREDSLGTHRTASAIVTHNPQGTDRSLHLFQLILEIPLFCY